MNEDKVKALESRLTILGWLVGILTVISVFNLTIWATNNTRLFFIEGRIDNHDQREGSQNGSCSAPNKEGANRSVGFSE